MHPDRGSTVGWRRRQSSYCAYWPVQVDKWSANSEHKAHNWQGQWLGHDSVESTG